MDWQECHRPGKVSYNQILDITDIEDSGGGPAMPGTLDEVKTFSSIDLTEYDDLIETVLMPAALKRCEDHCNISFSKRTFTVRLNNLNGGTFLPLGPIGEVTWADGEITTGGTTWKQLIEPRHEDITVSYEGGYDSLPANLKLAWMNEVRFLYDNRGEIEMPNISPMAKLILDPIRRVW